MNGHGVSFSSEYGSDEGTAAKQPRILWRRLTDTVRRVLAFGRRDLSATVRTRTSHHSIGNRSNRVLQPPNIGAGDRRPRPCWRSSRQLSRRRDLIPFRAEGAALPFWWIGVASNWQPANIVGGDKRTRHISVLLLHYTTLAGRVGICTRTTRSKGEVTAF